MCENSCYLCKYQDDKEKCDNRDWIEFRIDIADFCRKFEYDITADTDTMEGNGVSLEDFLTIH